MAQNITATSAAGTMRGVGAALLRRLTTDGADFTQAVQSTGAVTSPGVADVALAITTKSGQKVTLALHTENGGLSVTLAGADGLSPGEKAALGKLAGDFQAAMDGFNSTPPRIDLGGLASLDPAMFSSISLTASTSASGGASQSLAFAADASSRSIHVTSPAGKIDLSTDLSQPATWGSQAQRDQAVKTYLGQFGRAASRGHADGAMMAMFKDAFSQLNGSYGAAPAGTRSARMGGLSDSDHAVLSGLADFTASMTQTAVASNPYRSDEHDAFSYRVSQATVVSGTDANDRHMTQDIQSSLHASFHSALSPDATLNLSLLPSSQNYYFTKIDDSAQSHLDVRYAKGKLVNADLTRSAEQSTTTSKYVMAKLVDQTTSPAKQTQRRDLVAQLSPPDANRPLTVREQAAREATLASLHASLGLESDPSALVGS
jgi:hypothetical protein